MDWSHQFSSISSGLSRFTTTTTTTTHRPFVAAQFNTFPIAPSSSTGPEKPFNIFDFYRTLYNPQRPVISTGPNRPLFVSLPQNVQKTPSRFNVPQFQPQPVIRVEPKPVAASFITHPPPTTTTSTTVRPFIVQQDNKLITSQIGGGAIPNLSSFQQQQIPTKEIVKPVSPSIVSFPSFIASTTPSNVAAPLSVQSLEKDVAPPPAANVHKATLSPRIQVKLEDSGHKFINRFVVDEDAIRAEGNLPVKKILEKDVVAPPVNNIKPILSPKISVHVGESGHRFINRFVLTEDEKQGKIVNPSKTLVRQQQPVQNAIEQINYRPASVQILNSGQTEFTRRFDVDDVNKKLFQIAPAGTGTVHVTKATTASFEPQARAPQSQIFFNNRYDEGVNRFTFRSDSGNSRAGFSRSLFDNKEQPLFERSRFVGRSF